VFTPIGFSAWTNADTSIMAIYHKRMAQLIRDTSKSDLTPNLSWSPSDNEGGCGLVLVNKEFILVSISSRTRKEKSEQSFFTAESFCFSRGICGEWRQGISVV